jgi:hypothetical protein
MRTGASRGVTVPATHIDNGPSFGYDKGANNLAHVKDASRVTTAGGASAVPAGKGSSPLLSGSSGISLPAL